MDKKFNFWMMEEIAKDFQVNTLNSSTSDCIWKPAKVKLYRFEINEIDEIPDEGRAKIQLTEVAEVRMASESKRIAKAFNRRSIERKTSYLIKKIENG